MIKPTQRQVEHGLDSLIVLLFIELDKEKENLDKFEKGINIFKTHGYDMKNYQEILKEMKEEYLNIHGVD
jgi:hypothetical protein